MAGNSNIYIYGERLCVYIREIREEGVHIKVIGEEIGAFYVYVNSQTLIFFRVRDFRVGGTVFPRRHVSAARQTRGVRTGGPQRHMQVQTGLPHRHRIQAYQRPEQFLFPRWVRLYNTNIIDTIISKTDLV